MNREASRLLSPRLLFAAVLATPLGIGGSAAAQNLPVMVGEDHDTAVAALKARGIAYREEAASGDVRRVVFSKDAENVTLEFAPWPADADAPAAAYEATSKAAKRLTLTRIVDLAPSSGARRAWVNGFARDGHGWAYLSETADANRSAADRSRYPVAAYLQWTKPPATFVFQAARPRGAPPGDEGTSLEIVLENPHKPRRF